MRYVYPCEIDGNEYDGEGFVVAFPDVEGATSGGWSWEEALGNAEDALVAALGSYITSSGTSRFPAPSERASSPSHSVP